MQAVIAAEFGGKPIRAQSLSEWRKGGYRDWLARQEALEVAERLGEDTAEWNGEGRPPLTDTLALWLLATGTNWTKAEPVQESLRQADHAPCECGAVPAGSR